MYNFRSLTIVLEDIRTNQPDNLDRAYGLISRIVPKKDYEITIAEIEEFYNTFKNPRDQNITSDEVSKGKFFHERMMSSYSARGGNEISNRKANSLRRIERERLEVILNG